MTIGDANSKELHVGAVTGRYVLGSRTSMLGINVFACRLRSVSPTSFVAAAPVVGRVGDEVTASFSPFGTLHGRISRHVVDGFVVDIDATEMERTALAMRIEAFRDRVWTGVADKRAERRFMPGEPRSVLITEDGMVVPCLVVDYSIAGAAVSADTHPAVGARITIGHVPGHVVRLFDVGFAVRFDAPQSQDEIEELLAAPSEWQDAVAVVKARKIDTDDPDELFALSDYGD